MRDGSASVSEDAPRHSHRRRGRAPPCIWVLPKRANGPDYNWDGARTLRFPAIFLSAFGLESPHIPLYTGYVGFKESPHGSRTTITSRFGPGKTTTSRSS